MKKPLLKDSVKEIKNTYKRFISILLMAFLGVGFFAGLRATSPDMVDTIDNYYDEQNVYDIQILSTLGLTDEDIEAISQIENVEVVCGSYEQDGKIEIENNEIIAKIITLGELNEPVILSGNMPENESECLVEETFLTNYNKQIGDTIYIEIEDTTNDDGEEVEYLKQKEMTIVGTVQSPLYISSDRGTSSLGSGSIDYYIYIPKENINASDVYTNIYIQVKDAKKYTTSYSEYEEYIEEVKDSIEAIKEEREQARRNALVNKAQERVDEAEQELNEQKEDGQKQIDEAEQELNEAKQEIEDEEQELEEQKQEFEEKIAEAESELLDAKEEILEIENPTWYVLDRNANAGYVSFIQDTDSINNIAKVFPIVFFLVATLISLTSMTRMVEEQRMQIGTLKALGYNKFQIMQKYILYASLASIIGGILGMSVGFILLPKIIWMLYRLMYQLPDISISFNFKYGGIGLILIFGCIVGATIYVALKKLKESPATLMRPRAPKLGSRVFLEKIPFIWKRLNFSNKVTVRNIFRYKKRFYMTVIGILGCTSLILTGFGIKNSVTNIIPDQFEDIFVYDMEVDLKDSLTEDEKDEFAVKLEENERIEKVAKVYMVSGTAVSDEDAEDIEIIIPYDSTSLDGIININDLDTGERITLEVDEVCLTDKTAELLDVQEGDTIIIRDSDEEEVEVQVSNIVENYVNHYIFMAKDTFENVFGEEYTTNVLLTKNIELSEEEEKALASEILSLSEVASVTDITTIAQSIIDAMSLLDYVVVVLIVAAGLLAFVVLYNLANVNISERIRELATIKVLGFYDREVYDYITRETIILTVIGIVLGLIAGYFLNYYIMGTCEISILRFSKVIEWQSYVYAALITIVFTVIVNIVTYFSLKKINMVESLKSVE